MPIVLDETTRAAYLAESLASSRSALVVSALTGTVSVEVRDGSDVLRASGTMAAPWATSSGATITVGQVTGAGITVSSGGVPDADWYCQFKAGSRFVRGTFGVSTSSADFRWSLATFQTGSRGTLASVALTATGESSDGPALLAAPVVESFTGTLSSAGGILKATPAVWANENGYELTGVVGVGHVPAPNQLFLGAGASGIDGAYVGYFLCHSAMYEPPYVGAASVVTVTAYNGTTKVATTNWIPAHRNPPVGASWWIYRDYPVIRSWQWKRDGVPIAGAIDLVYTKSDIDIGRSITVTETGGLIPYTSPGSIKETPSPTSTATSTAIVVTGSASEGNAIRSSADFSFVGWFKVDRFGGWGIAPIDSSYAAAGTRSFIFTEIQQRAYEATLPTPSTGTSYAALPSPTRRRPANGSSASPWEGLNTQAESGVALSNGYEFRGVCQVPGQPFLVMSFAEVYSVTQQRAIFALRPVDLTATGSVQLFVPYDPAQPNSRWMAGTITAIPASEQTALGGDLLLSGTNLSVHGNLSQGPCAAVINSSTFTDRLARTHSGTSAGGTSTSIQLAASASALDGYYTDCYVNAGPVLLGRITAYAGATRTATIEGGGLPVGAGTAYKVIPSVPAKQLIGYRPNIDIFGAPDARLFAPIWDDVSSSIYGAAVIRGTGSCLVMASLMAGRMDYGFAINGLPSGRSFGKWRLYNPYNYAGPGDSLSGSHLPGGGSVRFWVYSVSDMASVASGARAFYSLTPTAAINLPLPTDTLNLVGMNFDNETGRLYVGIDTDKEMGGPAVVVYQCNRWA